MKPMNLILLATFLQNWPLFLSDSRSFDNTLSYWIDEISVDFLQLHNMRTTKLEVKTSSPIKSFNMKSMLSFQSPIYQCLFAGVNVTRQIRDKSFSSQLDCNARIRISASKALASQFKDLSLKKWFLVGNNNSLFAGSKNQNHKVYETFQLSSIW